MQKHRRGGYRAPIMRTTALIEKGKDGTFSIYTPDLDHTIVGSGNTVSEARSSFENSFNEMVLSYTEEGKELPKELQDITFDYKYDLASLFNYYSWINVTQFAKVAGINAALMRQYKSGIAYISESQSKKIEEALHKMGQELTAVKL